MKNKIKIGVFLCFLTLIYMSIPVNSATEITRIYTDRDAHVEAYDPNANFGGQGDMYVGVFFDVCYAFIHFSLSNMPETYEEVYLVLDLFWVDQTMTLQVYTTSNSWTELGITYNNAPGNDVHVGSYSITNNGRFEFNIGTILEGKTQISFRISLNYDTWITLTAKENDYLWDEEDVPNLKFTKEVLIPTYLIIPIIVAAVVIPILIIAGLKYRSNKRRKLESVELK